MADINTILGQYTPKTFNGLPLAPTDNDNAPSNANSWNTAYQKIFGSANSQPTIVDQKKAEVAQASQQKVAQMGNPNYYEVAAAARQGVPASSLPKNDQDLAGLTPMQLVAKYGVDGSRNLIDNYFNKGVVPLDRDLNVSRTIPQQVGDSALSAAQGVATGIGGGLALASAPISLDGSSAIVKGTDAFNKWIQSKQSDELNSNRKAVQELTDVQKMDNKTQQQKQIANGTNSYIAGLERVGKDAFDSISNTASNPTALEDGTANAIGSLLLGGPATKGVSLVGSKVIPAAIREGSGFLGEHAASFTANAALEGSNTYQQTASNILDMSDDDLKKYAPNYDKILADNNGDAQKAKESIARSAGLEAAAIDAPLGGLAGSFTEKLQINPFKASSLTEGLGNIGKEVIEEGTQGAASQLVQNQATKDNADVNQDLLDGVGEQIGQGALFGGLAAGTTQSLGLPKAIALDTSKVINNRLNSIQNRADSVANANSVQSATDLNDHINELNNQEVPEQSSVENNDEIPIVGNKEPINTEENPISNEDENQEEPVNNIPSIQDTLDSIKSSLTNVPSFNQTDLPETIKNAINTSSNNADLFNKIGDIINDPKTDDDTKDSAMNVFSSLGNYVGTINEQNNNLISQLPEDHPINNTIMKISQAVNNVVNSPSNIKAQETVVNDAQSKMDDGTIKPIPEDATDLNTPEQQTNINKAMVAIDNNPTKANPEVVNSILYHSDNGNINLSETQKTALRSAKAIIDAMHSFNAENENSNNTTDASNLVSKEITTNESNDEGSDAPSGLEHINNIRNLYNSGNIQEAAVAMDRFKLFAQHLQNKVQAINTHLNNGGGTNTPSVNYQALSKGKTTFQNSKSGLGVTPTSENSVKFAQTLDKEADMITRLYNNSTKAFPNLKANPIKGLRLDPRLNGNIKEIVSKFRSGNVTNNVAQNKDVEPQTDIVKEEETPNNEVVEPTKETIGTKFLNLVSKGNLFHRSFKLIKDKSNINDQNNPIDYVHDQISNNKTKPIDTKTKNTYLDLLDNARNLVKHMNKSLEITTTKKDSKGKSLIDKTNDGALAHTFGARLNLNFTQFENNKFSYNLKIVQSAALAGIQWLINTPAKGAKKEEATIKNILGMDADSYISDATIQAVNNGLTQTEAVNSLGSLVMQYLGVKPNGTDFIGVTDGLQASLGAEVLDALINENMVERIELKFNSIGQLIDKDSNEKAARKLILIQPKELPNEIKGQNDLLNSIALKEFEPTYYTGEDKLPVDDTILNSNGVKVTPKQKSSISNAQKGLYYYHAPQIDLYKALGIENILDLFGFGRLFPNKMNKNDYLSKNGKNTSVTNALKEIQKHYNYVETKAKDEGITVYEMPVKFAFGLSSVNRLQMQGSATPQSDKLMREVLFPTYATLDLENNADHKTYFNVALAQALGIKVHKESFDTINSKLDTLLNNDLKQSIDVLKEWHKDRSIGLDKNDYQILKEDLAKVGSTEVALTALQEYARYLLSNDKQNFDTPLYIEADGITNGPINAMVLHTIGPFDSNWVESVAKGGLFFDGTETSNEYNSKINSIDLYQTLANFLQKIMQFNYNLVKNTTKQSRYDAVNFMLNHFIKDISVNRDDEGNTVYKINRGATKNPLTITLYGSGAKGIASNFVDELTSELYSRMTTALKIGSLEQSLFDSNVFSKQEITQNMNEFSKALNILTNSNINLNNIDLANFSFNEKQIDALESNLLNVLVKPMVDATTQTVGQGLMDSTKLMTAASNIMATIYIDLYNQKINETIENYKQNTPGYKTWMYVSNNDITRIQNELKEIEPLVHSGDSNFLLLKQAIDTQNTYNGNSLSERVRVLSQAKSPALPGVLVVPAMTVGLGDGGMMNNAFNNSELDSRETLPVFDGMHMAVNKTQNVSSIMNQSVNESWNSNALEGISKIYNQILNSKLIKNLSTETIEKLNSFVRADFKEELSNSEILKRVQEMGSKLATFADEINKRHKAINMISHNVDQMAGTQINYAHNTDINLSGLSSDEIAQQLNKYMNQKEEAPKASKTLQDYGRIRKGGAREISSVNLKDMVKSFIMDSNQAAVLKEMIDSLATKGLKIITGTPKEIDEYTYNTGKTPIDMTSANGAYSLSDNTMYIVNPSNETLVHEVIHASTLNKLIDHFSGKTNLELTQSVNEIFKMMKTFNNLEVPYSAQEAYNNAKAAIASSVNMTNDPILAQAHSMNEFMAWVLSNKELSDLTKNVTKGFTPYLKEAINAIKKVVWGRRRFNNPPLNDMFSNLLFHTSVIARTNPTLSERTNDLISYHSNAFGTNDRLSNLDNKIKGIIATYLDNFSGSKRTDKESEISAALTTGGSAYFDMQNAFNMNPQQKSTFINITHILATSIKLNPNALSRINNLYSHVIKNLSVEDLMNESTNRMIAQEKLNSILGVNIFTKDRYDRSTLLPAFVALSMVDDHFRDVLSKVILPTSKEYKNDSVDNILNNAGNYLLDQMGARITKDSLLNNAKNSMDNLVNTLLDVNQENQNFIDQFDNTINDNLDKVDVTISSYVDRLTDSYSDFVERQTSKPNTSKLTNSLLKYSSFITKLASSNKHTHASEAISSLVNKNDGLHILRGIVKDFVGRNRLNSSIYDMIKAAHALSQKIRQEFRETVPKVIINEFKQRPTEEQLSHLHETLLKTDLNAVLMNGSKNEFNKAIKNTDFRKQLIKQLQKDITDHYAHNANEVLTRADNLAKYMIEGHSEGNPIINSNAYSISRLLGNQNLSEQSEEIVNKIDKLVSLYAFEKTSLKAKATLVHLMNTESNAIEFINSYIQGQRAEEKLNEQASLPAKINGIKGHSPISSTNNGTLMVVKGSDISKYAIKSMKVVAPYANNFQQNEYYMYSTVSSKAAFNQGIIQNIRNTVNGVDPVTGRMIGINTAGSYTEKALINKISRTNNANYKPVFDENGNIIAYDKLIDQNILSKLEPNTNIASVLGNWRGRQFEEANAFEFNKGLVDKVNDMYNDRTIQNEDEFVDLFGDNKTANDPIIADAIKLMPQNLRNYINETGRGQFMVHRELVDDIIGYRSASVGDAWTGTTRWSEETQKAARNFAITLFGNDAYKYAVNAESFAQNWVSNSKVTVVVKSIVVPFHNAMGNFKQLSLNGVPLSQAIKQTPKKIAETSYYMKNSIKLVELEAKLRAANGNVFQSKRIQTEIAAINDSFKRLSIYPLIQANELSSVSDMGITREEIALSEGKLVPYIENLVDKLPDSIKDAGRYALVTKDTALFQGLQKSVEYGDFIAKAIYYDHMIKKGKTQEEALKVISEEFVNYDRLSGRFRQYAESIGLGWYYNFKLRTAKIAAKEIRKNPARALLMTMVPAPKFIKDIGTPLTDNFFTQLADGRIWGSIGLGELFRAPQLNPWVNLFR